MLMYIVYPVSCCTYSWQSPGSPQHQWQSPAATVLQRSGKLYQDSLWYKIVQELVNFCTLYLFLMIIWICWVSGSACFWASPIRIHYSEVRIQVRLRILPFSHKCDDRTEINACKIKCQYKIAKIKFLSQEVSVPVGKLKEKNMKI